MFPEHIGLVPIYKIISWHESGFVTTFGACFLCVCWCSFSAF